MVASSLIANSGSPGFPISLEESISLNANERRNPPAPSIARNSRSPSAAASVDGRILRDQSLSGTANDVSTSTPREDADKIGGQDDEDDGRDDGDDQLLRRRSTLRPSMSSYQIIPHTDEPRPNGDQGSGLPHSGEIRLYASLSAAPSSTSISLDSQDVSSSLSSSPKSRSSRSFRCSNEELQDCGGSQAVVSDENDEPNLPPEVEDSVPQLIMPSIKMPSRRPFTQRGKAMGRLKIMIVGGKGVGKTSLIKSVVQLSDDIVHVDPFPSPTVYPDQTHPKPKGKQSHTLPKPNVQVPAIPPKVRLSEISASTKPYPQWWSELDEGKLLPRRKSMGDTVLERNLCFVDVSGEEDMEHVVDVSTRYIVQQLSKTLSLSDATENDLVSLMGGMGGSQVDLVFYLVTPSVTEADFSAIRRLSECTNVIPLLAKSDLLPSSDISQLKETLKHHLASHSLETFGFAVHTEGTDPPPMPPYAVCSALSPDTETMDASLLMSPDYVQPIEHSDLSYLLSLVFDPINMDKLRYTAATKLIRSRRQAPLSPHASQNSVTREQSVSRNQNSYLQARIAAYTAREENLAQARLARWATDLQWGLAQERARYEALAGRDRTKWLKEQISNTRSASPSAPLSPSAQSRRTHGRDTKRLPAWSRSSPGERIHVDDPLGLVRFKGKARKHTWLVLKWMGAGAFAGVVIWGYKNWDSKWIWDVWDGLLVTGA